LRRSTTGRPSWARPKSKSDRAKVQAAFNGWAGETGLPLAHLSVTLALSVD